MSTSQQVEVLTLLSGADDVRCVGALSAPGAGTSVARRCGDLVELLASATAGLGQVALVDPETCTLDVVAVDRLHRAGMRVVLLLGTGDAAPAVGADAVVERSDPDRVLVSAVRAGTATLPGPAPVREPRPVQGRGKVLAVWGPTGAPGRTTLAVNLAAELGALGTDPSRYGALLADADTYGGAVAQHLGLLEEGPGLVAAARVANQGVLTVEALAGVGALVGPGTVVLTGIATPSRWTELSGPALDTVWEVARGLAAWVVVDCGFGIERDVLAGFDPLATQRDDATLSALRAADVVLVVGGADAVGVRRLVRAVGDLDDLGVAVGAQRVVAVNRVRASAAGPRPAQAVREVLARFAGVQDVRVLPDDPVACDRALLAGLALRDASPGSAVRAEIVRLAESLHGAPAGRAGRVRGGSRRGGARRVPEQAH
ncbi:MinD-like ATPase involved in chromosome partitioning or flagellar assembly [Sediminihabitans luteus]|uniref:MinD-like ATPase involved in chromosome partitioning or flagellar assembly n=1 Tax=Sediminihabitans luteus TaxID=1138585 RepID=A0A2M9CDS6_9CELL|nr:hypothetical protein [Sediminihabitans luteus]PJJ70029.1 MinD-like ATPase involved in chromosome partitioning or flagellar assembly [Sediminihabitans luteus]GIJ00187.1 pilus biosynthesis protein CpaE [Sediminihabitans luteus]